MILSNARQAAAASNIFCRVSCLDVAAFGDGCDSGFAGCWLAVLPPALAGEALSRAQAQNTIRQILADKVALGFDSLKRTVHTLNVVPLKHVLGAIMSESTAPKFGMMTFGKEVIALQSTPMPILYFDGAPCLSHIRGVIGITLTVTGGVPTESGGVDSVASVVAYLKCSVPAAVSLRHALDKAILLAQPVENPEGKAN